MKAVFALVTCVIVGVLAWSCIVAQVYMVTTVGGPFCWGNPHPALFWTMMCVIVMSLLYTAISICRMVLKLVFKRPTI